LNTIEILGLVAGAITTASLLPQVIRVFKLKSARDISLLFNSAYLVGIIMWLGYGIFTGLVPIILWNAITLVLAAILLYSKFIYGK
jgi:MtN3 and saliva related transmembrane protein